MKQFRAVSNAGKHCSNGLFLVATLQSTNTGLFSNVYKAMSLPALFRSILGNLMLQCPLTMQAQVKQGATKTTRLLTVH